MAGAVGRHGPARAQAQPRNFRQWCAGCAEARAGRRSRSWSSRRPLRRPADGEQHRARVGAVRLDRLLDRRGVRRPRHHHAGRGDGDRPLLRHRRACTASRSRSGPRTPPRCASSRSSASSEVGFAPRFLHIDGDWRDHRIFAITGEECPLGMLARPARSRPRFTPVTRVVLRHTADIRPAVQASAPIVSPVDLSAFIFVVLAVAWAVYLIPKALKHHDEMVAQPVGRRPLRHGADPRPPRTGQPPRRPTGRHARPSRRLRPSSPTQATPARRARPSPSREAAGRATRRRRRVLGPAPAGHVAPWSASPAFAVHRLVVRRDPGRPGRRLAGRLPAHGPPRAAASDPESLGARASPTSRTPTPTPPGSSAETDDSRRRRRHRPSTPADRRRQPVGPAADDAADVRHQGGRARRTVRTIELDPASGPPATTRPTPRSPARPTRPRGPSASRATAPGRQPVAGA